jgi:hypothetical protein
VASVMLALVCWLLPYERRTNNPLAAVCQLVVLTNLQIALLLKVYKEEEKAVLRASGSEDVRSAADAARDEYARVASTCGVALVVLYALPALLALGLMVRDLSKREVWQEISEEIAKPAKPPAKSRPSKLLRRSQCRIAMARVSVRSSARPLEGKRFGVTERMSLDANGTRRVEASRRNSSAGSGAGSGAGLAAVYLANRLTPTAGKEGRQPISRLRGKDSVVVARPAVTSRHTLAHANLSIGALLLRAHARTSHKCTRTHLKCTRN